MRGEFSISFDAGGGDYEGKRNACRSQDRSLQKQRQTNIEEIGNLGKLGCSIAAPLLGRSTWGALRLGRSPQTLFDSYARFQNGDAFAFKEFALQGRVGFADEELPARADYAVPGDAFSRGASSHRPASGSRPAPQTQRFSQRPIGSNPAAGN